MILKFNLKYKYTAVTKSYKYVQLPYLSYRFPASTNDSTVKKVTSVPLLRFHRYIFSVQAGWRQLIWRFPAMGVPQ